VRRCPGSFRLELPIAPDTPSNTLLESKKRLFGTVLTSANEVESIREPG
jgi:hypothetical protein